MRPLSLTETCCSVAGGKAVLLQEVDLRIAIRIGELRDAARAMHELHIAERDAIDRRRC